MNVFDIQLLLREMPFRQFRICVSDGTVYHVKHPEFVALGLSTLIFSPSELDSQLPANVATVVINLVQIARIEILARSPSPLVN
jgi:hypothetical protein